MDLNVKQWRFHHQVQDSSDSSDLPQSAAKLPRLVDVQQRYQEQLPHPSPSGSHPPPAPLPLFVPQPTTKLTRLSLLIPPDHLTPTTPTRLPKMGSYFSVGQWQELELQALIFRHMLAGAAVPPQLLHLVKNSLLLNTSSPSVPPPHPLLQHYYNNSHYHPSLLQSGYWGRASLDPEPGRCRRTDGKKWRCSRDVVAGHKYCERHMHRGRNRSRKPVEIPTPSAAGDGRSGGVLKINTGFAAAQLQSRATYFEPTGPPPSVDLLHLNRSPSESRTVTKSGLFEADNEASGDGKSSGQVLRHFFDDWPRSLQEQDDNGRSNPGPITSSSPCLSISTPSNPTSDFSLKLSTGNGDHHQAGHQELGGSVVVERGRLQSNWAGGGGWGTTSMGGGPLAEALRSSLSTSNSSPTSVLHQLPVRISAAETSYIST